MTFEYPTAPDGHFFKIKQYTNEWTGKTHWILDLRERTFIPFISFWVDGVFLDDIDRESVAAGAKSLLDRYPQLLARRALLRDVSMVNKIFKGKNK